ncbi:SDR family NAD(P)-dependent oxidoreductase [Brevibacillus sp. NRS-1366]|uniref:SDR family NAD(P)-dependent oxidoreductase n=1 Tax=Brevibacillus sp. NRS-1366 TaxID=3233899 RepID=UPI003D1C89C5
MRLKDKVAFITGAGSGIGKSIAILFAREGAKVIVNDISNHLGMETVDEIQRNGGQAVFIQADVTDAVQVENAVRQAIDHYERIEVLVNNAGILAVGALHETSEELWDRVVSVNLKGVFLASKYVVPHMMAREQGVIINMSSIIAEMGLSNRAAYSASKGAVLALTKSMQVDYAPFNIRVNVLLPGITLTPAAEAHFNSIFADLDEAFDSFKQLQQSPKWGRPEDVALAALFLASDESSFMMGAPLYIDGGLAFGKTMA